MRKISIFNTVLCDLIIYWLVTSYKLLGTDHCITDGGERAVLESIIVGEKIVSPSLWKNISCLFRTEAFPI